MGENRPFGPEAPTEELEPLPVPYVSVLLLLLIIGIFLVMNSAGHGDVSRVARLFGDKENDLLRAGQWWRLVTPIFLHGGWGHLIANSVTLVLLGIPMERIYGARKFFLIYMLAGIAGNLCSFWFSPAPSLGASGALYGLMGAGLVFPLRFKDYIDPRARKVILTQLARAAIINLAINFIPELHLDRWAHIGGMIGGGLAALLWMPDVLEEEPTSRGLLLAQRGLTSAMLILVGWCGLQQWQTARHVVGEIPPYVVLDENDPWWGLRMPRYWQPLNTVGQEGVAWLGPKQALLKIIDSQEDPQLVSQNAQWIKTHHAQVSPYALDGKNGKKAVFSDGKQTVELHEIETDGRAIAIILTCSTSAYGDMQPAFEALLNTVRFVRPPKQGAGSR